MVKIAVIIAEYNPFHNGHAYHIEQTRAAGATHIAVVMSGSFVQRGEPAFLPKRVRAKAALLGGADLVLELPAAFACAPAERFAQGAVALAQGLGCAAMLSFGSENGSTAALEQVVQALAHPQLGAALEPFLAQGMPFAAARGQALRRLGLAEAAQVLENPNDTLAVEYLRALQAQGGSLELLAVRRQGVGHHGGSSGGFASASYLRSLPKQQALGQWVPKAAAELYQQAWEQGQHIDPVRLDSAVLAVLRSLPRERFAALPDLSEGLEHRLYTAVRQACSLEEIAALAKSRRYAHARLRRLVYSAFLGLPQTPALPPYLRLLGANPKGQEILAARCV